jgi:hypothetical protein
MSKLVDSTGQRLGKLSTKRLLAAAICGTDIRQVADVSGKERG